MTAAAELAAALDGLERAFDAALDAVLPNPVALIFTDLTLGFQGKRDLVFALDLLNEGENEAALIAGLAGAAPAGDPTFDDAHLVREAWYYLRTSIDPTWQFDDRPIAFATILAYVGTVLHARVAAARAAPPVARATGPTPAERRVLLDALRAG